MHKKQTVILLSVIILIATLTQICTDMYTPSLPAIASDLKTSLGHAQLTMTYFMAGIAITTIIYGPLSEGIGRRKTIMLGIGIALIGSVLCILATNIYSLQVGRLVQGCGLGACNALWRTIFKDTYSSKEDMARVGSYVVNIFTLSIIAAPFLGGYFQQYLSWRYTFMFLLIWMLMVLGFLIFSFTETSQYHGKHRLNLNFFFKAYRELLSNRNFMSFSIMVFFTYGGLFAWLTAGPVILIHGIGITPVHYGYLIIIPGLMVALGGIVNAKLTKKITLPSIIKLALVMMVLSGICLLAAYYTIGLNIYMIIIPAMIFIFGSTFMFMNGFAMAFEDVAHIGGYAGSLYACIQLLGGVFFSSILGHLSTNSPVPLGLMFMASGVCAWFVYQAFASKKT